MSDRDDGVGYGRPPKWTRFQRGKSGNPRGRPRKNRLLQDQLDENAADQALQDEINRKITFTEGGNLMTKTALELITRAQANEGIKGNAHAQREFIKSARELGMRRVERALRAEEKADQDRIEKQKMEERLFEHFAELKQQRTLEWEEALEAGMEEPDFPWPHPDDILLDHSHKKYRLRGPFSAQEVPFYHSVRARRDMYFTKLVLTIRSRNADEQCLDRFWTILLSFFDNLLPLRWQLGRAIEERLVQYMALPMHKLRKLYGEETAIADCYARASNPPAHKRETYRFANQILRPILKKNGYRSLAQFERGYEEARGDPPWPRTG